LIALGLNLTGIGQDRVTKAALGVRGCGRNTTGNLLDARQGMCSLHAEHAGGFLQGDYDYNEVTLEGRHFIPVGKRRDRGGARGGSIDGLGGGPSELPVPFFSATSWAVHQPARLGPVRVSPLERLGPADRRRDDAESRPKSACRCSQPARAVRWRNVWLRPWIST
jgi:hypothetical protein